MPPARPRPFRELRAIPVELRVPPSAWIAVGVSIALGVTLGAATGESLAHRIVRAVFFGSALPYLTISIIDFREHFLLERALTGRALSSQAVPLGETLNHLITIATLVSIFVL